jgi:hypothetical protein
LGALQSDYSAAWWAALPAAAAGLFQAAEEARHEYEAALAKIDSLALLCHEHAHVQNNGVGDPRLTPAFAAYVRLSCMAAVLASNLGANASRDFKTGPALLAAVDRGAARSIRRHQPMVATHTRAGGRQWLRQS